MASLGGKDILVVDMSGIGMCLCVARGTYTMQYELRSTLSSIFAELSLQVQSISFGVP